MCGVFGVFNARKAAELTAMGLHAMQHRAIDYAGIASTDGTNLYRERGAGLARKVFDGTVLDRLHGKSALGHIRYPTVNDDPTRDNVQPVRGNWNGVPFAIAHNGNLTNGAELQGLLSDARLSTSLDTEHIVRLLELCRSPKVEDGLCAVLRRVEGSFALGILLPDRLIAVRDPAANRPLSVGRIDDSYFVSSETCAFPMVGAKHLLDVEPGTMVTIDAHGVHTMRYAMPKERKCRFEAIYFSHPSSTVFGERVSQFRLALGRELARCYPVPGGADIVTPIPDSAMFIAKGYAQGSGLEYLPVILRNHYAGRTFIAATQAQRDEEVAQKFIFSAEEIEGKRIVVVDDSIVRGTTMPKIVRMLRQLGAAAVHVRIGCPPIRYSCRYGINTPLRSKLIAASLDAEEIRVKMGADSLEYLPLQVLQSLSAEPKSFCFACMTGEYW